MIPIWSKIAKVMAKIISPRNSPLKLEELELTLQKLEFPPNLEGPPQIHKIKLQLS